MRYAIIALRCILFVAMLPFVLAGFLWAGICLAFGAGEDAWELLRENTSRKTKP
jgi:hypothetical protein